MNASLVKKCLAEGLAVFTLTAAVSLSLQMTVPLPTAVVAALVVTIFVYTIGSLSGAHINPAVTVGLLAVQRISLSDAIAYIIAQCVGAAVAAAMVIMVAQGAPLEMGEESVQIVFGEALGAFVLVFGVSSVAMGKVESAASGLVVGGSLLVGILLAVSMSSAVLNPAVALGLGSLSLSYVVGPLLGGAAGALAYRALHS